MKISTRGIKMCEFDDEQSEEFVKNLNKFLVECFSSVSDNQRLSSEQINKIKTYIGNINNDFTHEQQQELYLNLYLPYLEYFDDRDFTDVDNIQRNFVRFMRGME